MESRLSRPDKAWLSTGTPSTGSAVQAAHIPGRWAAPPAPAMITASPRLRAERAYSASRSGVRCAETMRLSCGTSSIVSVSAACFSVAQSDWLPMMMPIFGPVTTVPAGGGRTLAIRRCYRG
jgi:hypothetical protein